MLINGNKNCMQFISPDTLAMLQKLTCGSVLSGASLFHTSVPNILLLELKRHVMKQFVISCSVFLVLNFFSHIKNVI